MNVIYVAAYLGDACYLFLTINFLWGLYCIVLLWRRVASLRFKKERDQLEFLDELDKLLEVRDFSAAEQLCQDDERALPQLSLLSISNRRLGFEKMRQMVAELMQRDVLAQMEFRLSWIATVIKSGPLLGLFGTVLGMLAAFGRIGTGVKVEPHEIAHEISIALICTAMGLATAIPFSYFLANLHIRVRSLQEALTSGMTRVLEHFKNMRPESLARRT